ncbi:mitochondrial import receptor subunit TOM20 homolog [Dysidea avara]|uniref:mitochondrial import receptor subunit TOM20 homolog n=1 Tax=Dysidea avara TaxID=196820 RepID=UPI00331CCAA8
MLRTYVLCAAGVCSALFLGYCVYFDRKRRNDPDYKKKVIARRKKAVAAMKKQHSRPGIKVDSGIDLSDPTTREEFLMNEMTLANQELMQGNVPDCITHLVNFVAYSGNPKATLATLQQTLPPTIFDLLIQVYASLEKKADKQEDVD